MPEVVKGMLSITFLLGHAFDKNWLCFIFFYFLLRGYVQRDADVRMLIDAHVLLSAREVYCLQLRLVLLDLK